MSIAAHPRSNGGCRWRGWREHDAAVPLSYILSKSVRVSLFLLLSSSFGFCAPADNAVMVEREVFNGVNGTVQPPKYRDLNYAWMFALHQALTAF